MGIQIDEINVEGLGPIVSAEFPLGPFNLIYGHNERGKTFLVEFVTRSLFKNLSHWSLRSTGERGKVQVSGLSNQLRPLIMTPSSTPKLEDLLDKEEAGLPSRISRLLVVKGADLSFDDKKRNGIDRAILKEFLSGEGVLDDIQKKISATVRGSRVENGEIDGNRVKENKHRIAQMDSLKSFDALFERIEKLYSGGERHALADQAEILNERIALQQEAKEHAAYQVNREMREVQSQLKKLPQERLKNLETDLSMLERSERRTARLESELAEFEQESEHYEWLSQAIDWYERRGLEDEVKPNRVLLIIAGIAVILAILFSVLEISAAAILLILVATVFGFLYWRQTEKSAALAIDTDEMNKLSMEFENRLGQPFSGLPQMKVMKEAMDDAHHGAIGRRKDLEAENAERDKLADRTASLLSQIIKDTPDRENWTAIIQELNDQQSSLRERELALVAEQAKLGVSEEDYRERPPIDDFDVVILQELIMELEDTEDQLRGDNEKLSNLKQDICNITGDAYTTDWEPVIQNLQERREGTADEYRLITAKILAGILVNDVLEENRAQEKEKIQKRLSSSEVGEAIYGITGRYTGAVYEEGQVWAEDKYGKFKISDLSTGAREQVLLGLRLGFASQIFKQRQLFLLLDDAFQHADWSRRKRLVDQSVALAEDGWQIIYFTMDDNIRDLFDAAGHKHFPDSYRRHDLNVPSSEITRGE